MKSVGAKVAEELSDHFRDLANYDAIEAANRQRWTAGIEFLQSSIRKAVTDFNENVRSGFQIQLSDSPEPFELHFRDKLTATAVIADGLFVLHSRSDSSSDSLDVEYLFLILISDDGKVTLQPIKDREVPSKQMGDITPAPVDDVLEAMLKMACGLHVQLVGLA